MKIRLATETDLPRWDAYVLQHPDGVAYHQFAWGLAVTDAYKFKTCYLLAESQERICGVLPFIVFKRFNLLREFVSLPYCDIAGCLADAPEISAALMTHAVQLATDVRAGRVELRQADKALAVEDCSKVRMVLELPASSEELFLSLKSKLRSQIRKPQKDGLTAKLGGVEFVDEFYSVFAENMRDLGSPVHSRAWFDSILKYYRDKVRIGLVYTPDGLLAAAGIILLHGEKVSIPWASSLRRYNRLNPNMLLYWTFLAFSADNGFRLFDFGRSTLGEGTYKFKAQWGAIPEALEWVQFNKNGAKIEQRGAPSAYRAHIEACWQRMPLSLCNFFGPMLRRYISL